jgi:hypothetical protein
LRGVQQFTGGLKRGVGKTIANLNTVKQLTHSFRRIAIAAALVSPVIVTGCAVHARYYDNAHRDYHVWGPAEREPYGRWEAENHRTHTDYKKLKSDDRQAYWNWRHDHP